MPDDVECAGEPAFRDVRRVDERTERREHELSVMIRHGRVVAVHTVQRPTITMETPKCTFVLG